MKISKLLYILSFVFIVIIIGILAFQYSKLEFYHNENQKYIQEQAYNNSVDNIEKNLKKIKKQQIANSYELTNRMSILYNLLDGQYFEDFFTELPLANSLINSNIEDGDYDIYIINTNKIITHATKKEDIGINLSNNKYIDEALDIIEANPYQIYITDPLITIEDLTIHYYAISMMPNKKNFVEIEYSTPIPCNFIIENISKSLKNNLIKEQNLYFYHKNENFAFDVKNQKLLSPDDFTKFKKGLNYPQKNTYFTFFDFFNTNQGYKIVSKIIMKDIDNQAYLEEKNIISITALLMVTLLFSLIVLIYNRIISPLNTLTKYIIHNKEIDAQKILKYEDFHFLAKSINFLRNKLKKRSDHIAQMMEQQKSFVANSIHELSTPLSVIDINTKILQMHHQDNENIDYIAGATNQIALIKEDIAFLLVNKDIAYEGKSINLNDFLFQRIDFFNPILISNEKSLHCNCNEVPNENIFISATELTLLIDNNISNAIKYSLESTIEITLLRDNDSINLSFINRGAEIKDTDKIFERFYRENNTRKGFGIGLNIVKKICQTYDIKYNVTSINGLNTFSYQFKRIV